MHGEMSVSPMPPMHAHQNSCRSQRYSRTIVAWSSTWGKSKQRLIDRTFLIVDVYVLQLLLYTPHGCGTVCRGYVTGGSLQ